VPDILAFDDFELDEPRFELRRKGLRVHVQPKVLRALLHLATNRERYVSTRELLEEVWPGEHVTVASVKRAIGGARRALGQRVDSEASIRTVRGQGYQFVAAVRVSDAAIPEPAPLFVGREDVLARFDVLLGEAVAGRGRSTLIIGEPGIGKSCVLHQLARRAASAGAAVLLGRCMEVEGGPALWPMLQILRAAADALGPLELRAHLGEGAVDIAEALPELRRWLPDLPSVPRIDPTEARFRFFESMTRFLRSAAHHRPLVVLIDDLQRADASSLRWFAYLISQIDDARILWVGSVRKGRAREPELLRTLLCSASSPRFDLRGFQPDELARYLALRTGFQPAQRLVELLHELTGGNVLFVEHVVHCLATGDSDPEAWLDRLRALPVVDVESAIERHLDALHEPSQSLLRDAAVLGRDFSVQLLSELTEQPFARVAASVEDAIAIGIVVSGHGHLGQMRFAHALIRDVLYAQLSSGERARLHGRAGHLLAAREPFGMETQQLSRIAEHFALAAPTHDEGLAIEYAVRAGRAAVACLSPEQAAAHFGRALQLLELSPPDLRARMDLLLEQGEALAGATDAAARTALLEAARIATELGAAEVVLRAALAIGRVRETGSVDLSAVDLLQRALTSLDGSDPRWPLLQAQLAKALSYGRVKEREQDALHALAAARQLSDPASRGEALHACLYALPEPQWLPQRIEIAAELEKAGHERSDYRLLRFAAGARVWIAVECGDMRAADAAIDTLESISRHVRDPMARWHAAQFRTMRALVDGQLDVAERGAANAHELGAKLSPASAEHHYVLQMHGVLLLDGRIAEAQALVREISLRHPALPGWKCELASHEARLGRPQHARVVLQQMLENDLAMLRNEPFLLSGLASATELCMFVGDAADAQQLYDALLPYEDRHGNVSFGVATHGPIARHLGRLALKIGREQAAERHLQRALEAAEAMPSTTYTSIACLSYANALLTTGRKTRRGRALLQRAHALASRAGLRGIEQLGRAIADRTNVRLEHQPDAAQ
jgi:DNA-binding winged helix-turn-helix (wHTH) protein/tetratricopeptide (TPR) repeat protein